MARILLHPAGQGHRIAVQAEGRRGRPGDKPATPADGKKDMKVDTDDLKDRVLSLPIAAANYRNLQSVGSTVYYIRQTSKEPGTSFALFDLNQQKETGLAP